MCAESGQISGSVLFYSSLLSFFSFPSRKKRKERSKEKIKKIYPFLIILSFHLSIHPAGNSKRHTVSGEKVCVISRFTSSFGK